MEGGEIVRQRITVEQLQSLSPDQQEKLREWWKKNLQYGDVFICEGMTLVVTGPNGSRYVLACGIDNSEAECDFYHLENCLPLLNIGQMLQLIQDNDRNIRYDPDEENSIQVYKDGVWGRKSFYVSLLNNDICNELWEAVKEIL